MFIKVYRGHVTESVTNEAKAFHIDPVIIHGAVAVAYVGVIINGSAKDHSKWQYSKFWGDDIDDMVFTSP